MPPVQHAPRPEVLPRKPGDNLVPNEVGGPRPDALPRRPGRNLPSDEDVPPISQDKAYRVKTDLDDPDAVTEAVAQILDQDVTLKFRRMLAISPALQARFKKLSTKARRSNFVHTVHDDLAEEMENSVAEPESEGPRNALPFAEDPEILEYLPQDAIAMEDLPFDAYVMITTESAGSIPEGAIIMGDPVLQYLESLQPGDEAKPIYIGLTSAALRCVFPCIKGAEAVEAILDSGSQIVSMAGATATRLGIPFDPDVNILMQSANGQIEKTLGLARNIPFRFGHFVVYLQVHILRCAPYEVLLGRPFDILTESVVNNAKDGSQTVTMTDPYGGARVTIPTFARGKFRQAKRPDIRASPEPEREEQSEPAEAKSSPQDF